MKYIKYCILGIIFGIIMTKSEVISWYRIQEMFRFQSFHMYGVIGSTVATGIIIIQLIKRFNLRTISGDAIDIKDKNSGVARYLGGGILFGLGWALSGACPGPMFTLIGNGYTVFIVVILSAVAGTYVYGLLRDKLPH
jgi:uncharacterized protein